MTNDKRLIEQWLDRYMEGTTTEQEERLLAEYFCTQTDIPKEWTAYAVIFRGFKGRSVLVATKRNTLRWQWAAVAAVLLVILGFGWQFGKEMRQTDTKKPVTALTQVKRSETIVSNVSNHQIDSVALGGRGDAPSFTKPEPKRKKKEPETVVATSTATEGNGMALLLNIDMTAVQQQGEELRTALAIANSEIFETE